jgi:hypothetical protein
VKKKLFLLKGFYRIQGVNVIQLLHRPKQQKIKGQEERTNCKMNEIEATKEYILFYSILFYSILFYSFLFFFILFYLILLQYFIFYSILFYSITFYSYNSTRRITAFGKFFPFSWGSSLSLSSLCIYLCWN